MAKIGLYAELLILNIVLCFPFERLGKYSRKMLEEQLVGCHWLLNGKIDNMPEEAKRMYAVQGKIIVALGIFMVLQEIFDKIIKPLVGRGW